MSRPGPPKETGPQGPGPSSRSLGRSPVSRQIQPGGPPQPYHGGNDGLSGRQTVIDAVSCRLGRQPCPGPMCGGPGRWVDRRGPPSRLRQCPPRQLNRRFRPRRTGRGAPVPTPPPVSGTSEGGPCPMTPDPSLQRLTRVVRVPVHTTFTLLPFSLPSVTKLPSPS